MATTTMVTTPAATATDEIDRPASAGPRQRAPTCTDTVTRSRHPQTPRDGFGLIPTSEAVDRVQAHPLPLVLFLGRQSAPVRAPHDDVVPQR